jgi:hypothetical protein
MTGISDLLDFRPVRLTAAREIVVAAHPTTGDSRSLPGPGRMEALRRRVVEVGSSLSRLESLAHTLTSREVRGLVTGLEQWEELRPAVRLLLSHRLRADLLPALWAAWQRFPLVGEVRSILEECVERFGWHDVIVPVFSAPARSWIASERPGLEVQQWMKRDGLTLSAFVASDTSPFTMDTPLLRLVREAVLTRGGLLQLRAEGGPRLLEWSRELDPQSKMLFGQNYLTTIPSAEWYEPILLWIERGYGLPKESRLVKFWEPIPKEIRRAFRQFFFLRILHDAFNGDPEERGRYWSKWVNTSLPVEVEIELRHVRDSRRTPYLLIDFGSFGVMEIAEDNNAAYFYDRKRFERIRSLVPQDRAELRERYSPTFTERDNRFIHVPSRQWDDRADHFVLLWRRSLR